MIEISKELSKHWNILLTEEDIADAYKNSNRHESDCFVLATSYYTKVQLNISNLQLIDGVLYADINEVEGLPMNIVKVDVEGGHLIAYYNEGIGQMSRIDLGSVVGPKGDAGVIPNISVGEVVTGAPGSNANVSITGTEEDPVLNFTIPRGAIGEVSEAELSKKLNEKADVISGTVSGDIVTFDGTGGDLFSCVANIEPIQSGTGDPSPTNIRPISGWDSVNVSVTGKNLLNPLTGYDGIGYNKASGTDATLTENSTGMTIDDNELSIDISANWSGRVIKTAPLKAGDYLVNFDTTNSSQKSSLYIIGTDGNTRGNSYNLSGIGTLTMTKTLYDGESIAIWFGSSVAQTIKVLNPQVKIGTNATSYEPYQGQTYQTTLPQTVYGGTLDVVSGVLTVDRVLIDLGSITNWRYNQSGAGAFDTNGNVNPIAKNNDCICTNYKTLANPNVGAITSGDNLVCINKKDDGTSYTGSYAVGTLVVKDSRYSDVEAFKSAMDGVMLCYTLATPQTYQLTPTEVRTILGGNTIYTDGGTIIAEYPADTEKYIDNSITNVKRLIAGIETDYIATKNYAVGDFLVVKNEFLKVVSAIANGEGIVVGQNVSATTVAEQLILLFNS